MDSQPAQSNQPPAGSDTPIAGRCGAGLRGKDSFCKRLPVAGGRRCRLHGGRGMHGAANPAFKNGRYAATFSGRLAAIYQQCEADAKLLSVRSEIALIASRIMQMADRVEAASGESTAAWKSLCEEWSAFKTATKTKDLKRAQTSLDAIDALIGSTKDNETAWGELLNLLDRKAALAAKEHAREKDLAAFVPLDDFMAMVTMLAMSIRSRVANPETARAIADDLNIWMSTGRLPAVAATAARLAESETAAAGYDAAGYEDDDSGEAAALDPDAATIDAATIDATPAATPENDIPPNNQPPHVTPSGSQALNGMVPCADSLPPSAAAITPPTPAVQPDAAAAPATTATISAVPPAADQPDPQPPQPPENSNG